LTRTKSNGLFVQYAALPCRHVRGELEILLITTRNTKRWIVPKGWPLSGYSPSECAAQEAMEEAGIIGEVADKAFACFHYDKRRGSGDIISCEVHVFTMKVLHQRRNWAEKAARDVCWCSVEEALAQVAEPGLKNELMKFAKLYGARKKRSNPHGSRTGRLAVRRKMSDVSARAGTNAELASDHFASGR
jgi:8-oxo-dGTP pyrophosphatase MutT (NUDIX family)